MTYFKQHLFVCTNERPAPKACCEQAGARALAGYLKGRLKALGEHGAGKIRVTTSGCLGRCDEGPCLVVYPEGTWYTYKNEADIDRIIESHLLKGELVEDLTIAPRESPKE